MHLIEELIPFSDEQVEIAIEKLTQIYALILGWQPKTGDKNNGKK